MCLSWFTETYRNKIGDRDPDEYCEGEAQKMYNIQKKAVLLCEKDASMCYNNHTDGSLCDEP